MAPPMLTAPAELPLSRAQLAVMRVMLEEQRAFRIDQLRELRRPEPHGPLGSTDPEILRSLTAGARAALHDVQAALWRMDAGTYGRCVVCDEAIPAARLEVIPQTARCLACQRPADRPADHPADHPADR